LALRWLKRVRLRPKEHSVPDRPHQGVVRPSAHARNAPRDSFSFLTDALDEQQLVPHERDKRTVIRAPLQRSNRRLHRHLTKFFCRNGPIVLTFSDIKLNSSVFIARRKRSLVPSHAHDFDRPAAIRPFARVYRIPVQHPLILRCLIRLPLTRRMRDFARPRAARPRAVSHDKVTVSTAHRNLTRVSRRLTPRHRLVLRGDPHCTYRREHQSPHLWFTLPRVRNALRHRRHRCGGCLSSLARALNARPFSRRSSSPRVTETPPSSRETARARRPALSPSPSLDGVVVVVAISSSLDGVRVTTAASVAPIPTNNFADVASAKWWRF